MNNKKALGKTRVPRKYRKAVLADARVQAKDLARQSAKQARNRRSQLRKLARGAF